jgi:hypothetical protein
MKFENNLKGNILSNVWIGMMLFIFYRCIISFNGMPSIQGESIYVIEAETLAYLLILMFFTGASIIEALKTIKYKILSS